MLAALTTTHRFGSTIGEPTDALRAGDADRTVALLTAGNADASLVDPGDAAAMARVRQQLTAHAVAVRAAAIDRDGAAAVHALDQHRLLCAHREGPWGIGHWNRQVERWLGEETGAPVGAAWGHEWYAGRPVLVTANDYGLGLYNGDAGVTVLDEDDRLRVVMADGRLTTFAPSRLGDIETLHAMTVHKSQGSQARQVTALLPDPDSPLLTRELFYTAVTRAQDEVRVVGTEAAVRAAVAHTAQRATGLAQRLSSG
jgi:exodeoxyribonuclease V alpha subunit